MRWSLILLHFIIFPALFSQSPGDEPDYRKIFGTDYEFAINTIEEHSWWSDSLEKHGIDPHFALSVIFPELIRYSSIIDYIQVKGLEVLYVQYGNEYADFSIGLFQIKPTFAAYIEADLLNYQLHDNFPSLSLLDPKITDDIQTRKERIIRLKGEYFQLVYLEAFIRIMDHIYPEISAGSPEEKLLFYATAYNTGYFKGEKVIREGCEKIFFHLGMSEASVKYPYSQIALYFYRSILRKH